METKNRYNKDYFENYDENYLKRFDCLSNYFIKKFSPRRVLDIGCAKGFLVHALRKQKIETFGIDISKDAIETSPKEVKDFLSILDIEKEKLPFPSDSFDLIIAMEVIEHLKDHGILLKEISRVLKPNGVAYLTTPSKSNPIAKRDITHVNVNNKSFWVKEFNKFGFRNKTNLKDIFIRCLCESKDYGKAAKQTKIHSLGKAGLLLKFFYKLFFNTIVKWEYTFILKKVNKFEK